MIELNASTFLLQWSTGGLLFLWVTLRRRELGRGYGWLLRSVYLVLLLASISVGLLIGFVPAREIVSGVVVILLSARLFRSVRARKTESVESADPLDLLAPLIGAIGLVITAVNLDAPVLLSVSRALVGAAFLGVVTDAMLLGHWYLVQPGLGREALNELTSWLIRIWPFEIAVLLLPTGMISVLNGSIDDGYGGILGWFWVACAITTLVLGFVTIAALKERAYSAVMAATGLLYLAILTAFGTDLIARAVLAA